MSTDAESSSEIEDCEANDIIYKLEDTPPWLLSLVLGAQHYLLMFSGAVAIPFLIAPALCLSEDSTYRGHIISTSLFVSGLASFLQTTFGVRLPIIQAPSLTYLIPALTILSLPQWKCPSQQVLQNMTEVEESEIWMSRMREVQGTIIVGAIIEMFVGFTGLVGFLLKWITPLSIAPTIILIGLSLFKEAARQASGNWWISSFTIFLLILLSQCLAAIKVPRCSYSAENGWKIKRFYLFKLFPVILTILFAWTVCGILTAANVLQPGDPARTDIRLSAIRKTPWIRVPYPGQWGMPTFNFGPALGVIAAVVSSTIESIGDYVACARLAHAPIPPTHAVNRGIMVEGLGCILSGFCGSGGALTSFSQNVGAIAITKVASRRVVQFASFVLIVFGMIGKFGVLFIIIPSPIMGGIFFTMFALITGVGLSSLQHVNLNSSRNLFVLGFAIFMGLTIPSYLDSNPDIIKTGSILGDQMLEILLKTSMFVAGFLGCLLDNIIPGSEVERGILKWRAESRTQENGTELESPIYNLPFGMTCIRKYSCFKYFPISPTYKNGNINICFNCCSRRKDEIIKPCDETEITLNERSIP